ncbi:MAG TPA: TolC family protein [Porphyromonadaceae bacterium]|nr:TolC family protein [Porphyromonadaceae bacterium]
MILLLLGVLFGLWATTAYAQQTDTLRIDLNTALDIALSENPNMKVADMEITKKQYAKKSAYGTLLPQIDLIGQYQRTLKRQTMYLDGDFSMLGNFDPSKFTPEELKILDVLGRAMAPAEGGSSNEGIQVGRKNSWTTGVNVSLPLVVPSLWKNIQISQVDIELAMEEARSSKINLRNQVKKAFFSLLLAKDSYEVFKETYRTDSINLDDIKNKFKQGIVPEYDVITADVRLKSIIPNILQADNMKKIAELQLKMLMGIDSEVPMTVSGALSDYEESMFQQLIPADTSMVENSDLKQFDLQSNKAQKAYELQKLQFAPTLTSSFNYMYMSQNNDFRFRDYRWDPYSVVGVTLSIPLFNGGQRYYNVKQSQIQLWQLQEQRKDLERSLKLSLKNNIDLIHKNIEQIVATQSSVEQARKGYEITRKRYETGLGTIVDVNAAALAMTSAELQYRNAIYDYLAAKADLEKVLGYEL